MTLQWFSIQILVNFYIFELSPSLFLTTLGFRLPVVNGDLSPMNLQEMFSTVWKFTNLYGKPLNWVTGWQVQNLLIFSCGCDRYLWDTRPNIYRLPNFETLFSVPADNCFRIFKKLITWSTNAKDPFICISLQGSLLAGYYCIKYGIRTPPPLGWGPVEFFWGKFKQLEDFLWDRVKNGGILWGWGFN